MTEFLQAVVTIVLFFAILGALVVIHELGHFIVARLAGVRVLEFGIGFPPRAKVIRSKGETLYTLNWLPIGGFVKLEGEDGDQANDPRSFSAQSLPVRLAILVAGVVMNIALAFAIFTGIVWLASPYVTAKFDEVQPDSPAAAAGLRPGESIVAVDGQRFQFFVGASIVQVLRSNAGETVIMTVESPDGAVREVPVTLRDASQIDENHGALGIAGIENGLDGSTTTNDLPTAIAVGADETLRWMGLIVGGLGSLVASVVADPTAPPPVSGPIGIATQIGDVFWEAGPDLDAVRGGDPVGQPRRREHPALPAARRRSDADDHAQAHLRRPHQPARRAADLPRRVRLPVRVPHLGLGLRHPPEPGRGSAARS